MGCHQRWDYLAIGGPLGATEEKKIPKGPESTKKNLQRTFESALYQALLPISPRKWEK
jgi:hypothetical protein